MIELQNITIRHERRIRVLFSNTLAAGAFTPSLYTFTSLDDLGAAPTCVGTVVLADSPNVVELVLDTDLVDGARYTLSCPNVPALDASLTPTPTSLDFRFGQKRVSTNLETIAQSRDRILYKIDLIWNGVDFQETATGDLDRVDGTANVTKSLNRGLESNGLTWAPNWGAGIREYVDSPSPVAGTMRGAVAAQCKRDPRVRKVKVTFEQDVDKTYMHIEPTLISGQDIERVSITVPSDG